MIRSFLVFGSVVLASLLWTSYTGWSFQNYQTVNNVPRSVRTNPGVYRSVYSRLPHK
jgi:hypothetical protein